MGYISWIHKERQVNHVSYTNNFKLISNVKDLVQLFPYNLVKQWFRTFNIWNQKYHTSIHCSWSVYMYMVFQSFGLEYERYLREVVMALEEDDSFRKKLEEANMTDIKVRRSNSQS